ncbi:FAD-binding oxidoreductase [Methanococcoides sp. SA1]|nr:FAD-binding oxidoreductase [Methanococcoides sp. SA1]
MRKNLFRSYRSDASRMKGKVVDVLHPRNVAEVSRMVRGNKKIVIRGAGTGLAGGAVPQGEVVLDLSKLVKIGDFDKERKTIVVEAGVVLDDLQDDVKESGLEFPVKPSSHAVATIGGMIATNAVGNRGVKYGKTGEWVKWVEVVDGEGRLERKGITEMSDFVGMEGITGVIVRACLKLDVVKERSASLLKVESLDKVVDLVLKLKRRMDVSGVEFLDRIVSKGIGLESSYHLLVEVEGEAGKLRGEGYREIMAKRDMVYPFVAGEGYTRIEDPKVMVNKFPQLMSWLEKNGIPTFGHIGTGILHPCFNVDQERLIPEMMKLVKRLGGQVSGEHGIGLLKRGFVEVNDQKILRNVKKRCDPAGKFNAGKVI